MNAITNNAIASFLYRLPCTQVYYSKLTYRSQIAGSEDGQS